MNMIKKFITSILEDNNDSTSELFNNLMTTKVNTVLDIKRVELTADIFNKQDDTISESADDAYKSALEQEMANPRFVEAHQTISDGLTRGETQTLKELVMNWHVYGGSLQQLLRGFYQTVYTSENNTANPVMQKALAYVLDKL